MSFKLPTPSGGRWAVLACLLAATFMTRAQAEFQPGYLVKTGTDTVRGLVDYRSIAFNARSCRFQPASGAAVEEYTPGQVRAYGLASGLHYEAHTVLRPDSTPGPYFLEVAEPARPLGLLLLYDEAKRQRYFLKKADGSLVELVQRTTTITDGGRRFQQVRKPYLGELALAFDACPAEKATVQRVELKPGALGKAIHRYNECVAGHPLATPARPNRSQLSVVAGAVVWHDLTIGPGNGTMEVDDQYAGGGPVPLVGIQYRMPTFFSQRLTAVIGASYHLGYSYKVDSKRYSSYNGGIAGAYRLTSAELRLDYLQVPLLVRYTAPLGAVRLYVEGGAGVRVVTRTTKNEVIHIDAGIERREQLYKDGPRRTNLCLSGGVGAEVGRGRHAPAIGLRYEVGPGGSPYLGGSRQRTLAVLVGYPLF